MRLCSFAVLQLCRSEAQILTANVRAVLQSLITLRFTAQNLYGPLSGSSIFPSFLIPHSSLFIPHPSSLIPHPEPRTIYRL